MASFDNPAMSTYAITSSIVALQLVVLALYTGRVRVKNKQYINPEDAKFNKGENADADHPDVERVKRAHANLLENAVPFFVVGALFVATNPSRVAALAYFWTFAIARILHSFLYIAGRQPFRTLMFAVGALSIIGMGIHVIRAAI